MDEAQIKELDELFDELHPELPKEGFISKLFARFRIQKEGFRPFQKSVHESYERIFKNYTPFGGSFLFKVPSENSDLVLHQIGQL